MPEILATGSPRPALPPFMLADRPGAPVMIDVGATSLSVWSLGEGPPLLFLHGLGWDSGLWWPMVRRWAGRFRVICPDTRGHGASFAPPGPYSIKGFAVDMLRLLDALGIARTAVVGLSQGGMTALTMATSWPERIGNLSALATAARVDPTSAAALEERILAGRTAGPEAAARLAARGIFSDAFLAATPGYLEAFVAWRAAMPAAPLEAATRAGLGYDVTAALPGLSVPTLVVAGGADRLIPPQATRAIAEGIPGATYAELAGAGHILSVEQPEALASLLDRQLAGWAG